MTTCPRCGAGNKPEAVECRMCKGSLSARDSTADAGTREILPSASTVVLPNLQTQPGTMILGELAICPACSSLNETSWAFCQQCGNKIDGAKLTSAPAQEAVQPQQPQKPEAVSQSPAPPPPATVAPPPDFKAVKQADVAEEKRPEPQAGSGDEAMGRTIVMGSIPRPSKGRLRLITENGEKGEAFDLKAETVIGRMQGDITFSHDGFMSGRHARIVQDGTDFILLDEGSRNGVFVRIKKEVKLEPGDYILIGRQLFQFET